MKRGNTKVFEMASPELKLYRFRSSCCDCCLFFVDCFMMLKSSETAQRRMVGLCINDDLERIWNEAMRALSRLYQTFATRD
jgi:hypothetical protein